MNNKKTKMPLDVSVHIRYLYQDKGLRGKTLLAKFPQYSKSTIYRHAVMESGRIIEDKRHNNPGRKPKLTERDNRSIIKAVKNLRATVGAFHSTDVQREALLIVPVAECHQPTVAVSNRKVRRCMRKNNLRYIQCRKKGILLYYI
jgi:hypothetical protein